MNHNHIQEPIYQNPDKYNQIARHIEDLFNINSHKLQKVRELAQKIKKGIENLNPFIQQGTEAVCPSCTNVCCVNKHSYYNYEDLVYIYALGLKIPDYDFEKKDSFPCQFLSEKGCVMDRSVRPSGCNWYFCEPLFEFMESKTEYGKFDDKLRDVAELWLELIEEYHKVTQGKEKHIS